MSVTEWPVEAYALAAIIVCCGWTAWATHRLARRSFRKAEQRQWERFTSGRWTQ